MKSVKIASLLLISGMLLGSAHSAVTPVYTAHAQTKTVPRDASKVVTLTDDDVKVVDGIITELTDDETATKLWDAGELVIPAELDSEVITGIGNGVFSGHRLSSEPVTPENKGGIAKLTFAVPENITSIGGHAFSNNKLTKVVLPSVTRIETGAFALNAIDQIELPEGVKIAKPSDGLPVMGAFAYQRLEKDVKNQQGEVMIKELLPSLKIDGEEQLTTLSNVVELDSKKFNIDDQKITLKDKSQSSTAILTMNINNVDDWQVYSISNMRLTIRPDNSSVVIPPTGDDKEIDTPIIPDTNSDTNTPDNGNNESPITISPDPEVNRPHTVYAKRAMRLHSNVSLTNPTKSYKKQSRAKAASFRIQGVSYDNNGKKRYKVKGGYITASTKYIADSHFRSSKVKQVRVIGNKVNSYKNAKLSKSQQVRSYKKGTKLKVKRIVKQGRTTRFQLNNGHYITGNKQLLIMDHSK